ncbi:hypothetical protein [Vulgatibacter sp.]|uniref:hypothetical protein n=1 Tax=Vulgatibacter sp. TaxID=1971226 RepID=UPI003561F2F8
MAKTKKTIEIPEGLPLNLAEVPRYAAQVAKQKQLEGDLAEIERQIREKWQTISAGHGSDEAAAALLDGDTSVLDRDLTVSDKEARAQLDALHDKRRLVEKALQMQKTRISQTANEVSQEICGALAPGHRALLQQIADKLAEVAELVDDERRFREVLQGGGVRVDLALPNLPSITSIGLRDNQSRTSAWLREAQKIGLEVTPKLKAPGVGPLSGGDDLRAKDAPTRRSTFARIASRIAGKPVADEGWGA